MVLRISFYSHFWDEAPHPLMIIMYLLNVSPPSFDVSHNEDVGIFNNLMSNRSYAFNYYEKMPLNGFKKSYMLKRGEILSTLGFCKLKGSINYSQLVSIDFKPKNLRPILLKGYVMWSKPLASEPSNVLKDRGMRLH